MATKLKIVDDVADLVAAPATAPVPSAYDPGPLPSADELASFDPGTRGIPAGEEGSAPVPPVTSAGVAGFDPAPTRNRRSGWTADRQRRFIEHLSLSASVGESAALVGLSSRSAYMLRNKAGAESFDRAWTAAISLCATRLAAVVFDRALHGRSERIYRDGELVMERKVPSDYLLTWLLARLDPLQFGSPAAKTLAAAAGDPRQQARNGMPGFIAGLADIPEADCPTQSGEFLDERLGEVG